MRPHLCFVLKSSGLTARFPKLSSGGDEAELDFVEDPQSGNVGQNITLTPRAATRSSSRGIGRAPSITCATHPLIHHHHHLFNPTPLQVRARIAPNRKAAAACFREGMGQVIFAAHCSHHCHLRIIRCCAQHRIRPSQDPGVGIERSPSSTGTGVNSPLMLSACGNDVGKPSAGGTGRHRHHKKNRHHRSTMPTNRSHIVQGSHHTHHDAHPL